MHEPTRTLPAWTYTSPEFYEAERERIFRRGWLVVGHVSQFSRPGDYVSMVVAGEPVMAVCGDDGELRGFSNVCRHRASRVVDGAGNCGRALRCPYHGWTYSLDGRLLAVPEKTGFPGFDRAGNGLWPLACETAAGFVFVSLDPQPEPLRAYLGDAFYERLAPYRPERLIPTTGGTELLDYNWKVSIDNYLEGYHIPVGHPSLLRLLDYRNYVVETTGAKVSLARSPIRDKASKIWRERLYQRTVRPMPGLPPVESETWSYIFAFPGMTWNLYPDQIDTWLNYPVDHRVTRTHWQTLRAPENSSYRDRAVRRLNVRLNGLVQEEDVELCERVQDGLGSHLYRAGVIGARENGLKHFHDLVRDAIPAATIDHPAEGATALRELEAAAT
ncbi:MAG TPA: aromatic ring-hydroxylating dioxygenase subunit alpha [Gaiellales bacterium]|nr:aromatic ring-hydroxylating dioxygenase subunit alpha [Gaiellales bacterium]